ncbi:hypothetical protein D3C80_1819380 [compost metagenome]
MLLDQYSAGFDDVPGFAVEQANGLDVLRQPLHTQGMDCLRGIGHWKQFRCRLVDADIRSLRRQDHGDQQFERR